MVACFCVACHLGYEDARAEAALSAPNVASPLVHEFGVRFNCICSGRVETPFVRARLKEYPDPEAAYRDMASTQLNGRMAKPEEVAAALCLASDESAMITGSALMIDGGWSAGK